VGRKSSVFRSLQKLFKISSEYFITRFYLNNMPNWLEELEQRRSFDALFPKTDFFQEIEYDTSNEQYVNRSRYYTSYLSGYYISNTSEAYRPTWRGINTVEQSNTFNSTAQSIPRTSNNGSEVNMNLLIAST
jgi:hypothetical protein